MYRGKLRFLSERAAGKCRTDRQEQLFTDGCTYSSSSTTTVALQLWLSPVRGATFLVSLPPPLSHPRRLLLSLFALLVDGERLLFDSEREKERSSRWGESGSGRERERERESLWGRAMKNQGRREDWFSEVVVEEEGCSERRKRERSPTIIAF